MKIMEKAKRFFTLNAANHEGFTLVELIVVIAILAILAGVAVPAYSGYIEKSKRAGDETLLAAVNKAFASACLAGGTEIYMLNSKNVTPTILLNDDRSVNLESVAPYGDEFKLFFEGNENAQFQVIESLVFDWGSYMFVDPANVPGGKITVSFGGSTFELSSSTISAMQNSTFGNVMGGEALLNEVAGLTNLMGSGSSKLSDTLLADTAQGGYMQKYAAYLGVEGADSLTGDDLLAAVEEKLVATYTANGIVVDETNAAEKVNSAMVNGMVFYAAEGMKDYTVESATEFLNSDNILGNLSTDPGTKLAQASLVYGMYAGFVNSEFNKGGATSSTSDPMAAIDAVSGDGAHAENFQKYLDSAQGKADVEAYMEAMNVINNASGNDVAASILVKGFADSELESLMTQVLGK